MFLTLIFVVFDCKICMSVKSGIGKSEKIEPKSAHTFTLSLVIQERRYAYSIDELYYGKFCHDCKKSDLYFPFVQRIIKGSKT